MRESDIQKAILDWLCRKGIFHWRCNLGGVRRAGKGLTRNTMRGFPDIAGIIPGGKGQLFVVEVKTPSGKLSAEQARWREHLEMRGCLYILARSVDDLSDLLTAYERYGA